MDNEKRYEECLKVIKKLYPDMKHLEIKTFDDISSRINAATEKQEKLNIVNELNNKLLTQMEYFALLYSRTDLKLENFEDYLPEYWIYIIDKFIETVNKGRWFKNYYSYVSVLVKKTKNFLMNKIKISKNTKFNLEDLDEDIVDDRLEFEQDILEKYNKTFIENVLKTLPAREYKVVVMYFGLEGYDKMRIKEITKYYNITRSRVMQILYKALRNLREPKTLAYLQGKTKTIPDALHYELDDKDKALFTEPDFNPKPKKNYYKENKDYIEKQKMKKDGEQKPSLLKKDSNNISYYKYKKMLKEHSKQREVDNSDAAQTMLSTITNDKNNYDNNFMY